MQMERRTMNIPLALSALLLAGSTASAASGGPEWIWWEGEKPSATNFPRKTSFSASTFPAKRAVLSGGDWLTYEGKRGKDDVFARYTVKVPVAGEYRLWCRKFWKHGPFRWRFSEGEWTTCPRDVSLMDSTDIRKYLCANWVYLGTVTLDKGPREFELRLLVGEGEDTAACFDAFVLTRGPFLPRGKLKPGERSGKAAPGYFAWEPAIDPFREDALLDLRQMNETYAGEHGFIRRDGPSFSDDTGRKVRFWAVNTGYELPGMEHGMVDYFARHIAKLGVNMVRIHGGIADDLPGYPVNEKRLDDLHYAVAALKKHGVYSYVSFYFPLWYSVEPGKDGKNPFALIYYEPSLQKAYREWLRTIMTSPNPWTGKKLAEDPAVAIVELVNEDSFFFWTFSRENVRPEHWTMLEKRFGSWLAGKYGSVEKAVAAWGGTREPDDGKDGRAVIYEAWPMTGGALNNAPAGRKARVGDQVRFLAETQRGFYADTISWMRGELGIRCLVNTSNWTVSDPAMLDAVEKWTYAAGDMMDRHGYYDKDHKGDAAGYSVAPGQTFRNSSALKEPEDLPIQFMQTEGFPQIITEIGWTNPNIYRAEQPFLSAAYGSLQGADGIFTFAVGVPHWEDGIAKFGLACPSILGGFPACSIAYRRGDIAEAAPVVRQVVDISDLFAMKGSGGFAAQALDQFRKADVPAGREPGEVSPVPGGPAGDRLTGTVNFIDPLSFFAGPVVRAFKPAGREPGEVSPVPGGPAEGESYQVNLSKLVDRKRKVVTSLTGELAWDYGKGLAIINTTMTQGAAGFLAKAGTVRLGDVTVKGANEYAVVMVTSLDGTRLSEAGRILIQATTTDRPFGFKVKGGKKDGTIDEVGGYPLTMEKVRTTVTLKASQGKWKAIALDGNGYATKTKVAVTGGRGKPLSVILPADAIWTVLERM